MSRSFLLWSIAGMWRGVIRGVIVLFSGPIAFAQLYTGSAGRMLGADGECP